MSSPPISDVAVPSNNFKPDPPADGKTLTPADGKTSDNTSATISPKIKTPKFKSFVENNIYDAEKRAELYKNESLEKINNVVKEMRSKGYKEDTIVEEIITHIDKRKVNEKMYFYKKLPIKYGYIKIAAISIIIFLILFIGVLIALILTNTFENKETYDPYGTGIRHFVSRDDTGAINSSLEERQFGSKPLKIEPLQIERLTSSPEPPNFSKHYNIEANIKDGTVMIERENFENMALNNDKLNNAMQGL